MSTEFGGIRIITRLHNGFARVVIVAKSETMMFTVDRDNARETREIISLVFEALNEKGYNPINQLVGYILSGDPTYITSHKAARNLIRNLERDELLEEIVKYYVRQL